MQLLPFADQAQADLAFKKFWWTALSPPFKFSLDNYSQMFSTSNLGQSFFNSFMISIPATIIPVTLAAFAAYAFAWMKFPGRDWIFLALVGLLAVPLQLTFVPHPEGPRRCPADTGPSDRARPAALHPVVARSRGLRPAVLDLSAFELLPSPPQRPVRVRGDRRGRNPDGVLPHRAAAVRARARVPRDLPVPVGLERPAGRLIYVGGTPNVAPVTVTLVNLVGSYGQNYQLLTAAAFFSMIVLLVVFLSLQRYFVRGILAGSVKG